MRRLFWWQLSVLLLLAGMAAGAQVPISNQNGQPPAGPPGASATPPDAGDAPTTPTTTKPEVTITGKPPRAEPPLPKLPPDEFTTCMSEIGLNTEVRFGRAAEFLAQAAMCEQHLSWEKRIVIEACINRDGKTALPRVIQACTESLDRNILEGRERFYLFVDRADGYFAQGDKQHARRPRPAALPRHYAERGAGRGADRHSADLGRRG